MAEEGLRARRGAPGEQHGATAGGAALCHPPGVVARVALLLVGAVVLLVDHDQPDVAEGSEHRGARTNADLGGTRPQPRPLVESLARRELGMQDRHGVAEALYEARGCLGRERDLGNQHDRRPAALECRLNRPQINLGLARPGDPMQQQAAVRGPRLHRGHDLAESGLLGRSGALNAARCPHPPHLRSPRRLDRALQRHKPAALQAAGGGMIAPCGLGQRRYPQGSVHEGQDARLAGPPRVVLPAERSSSSAGHISHQRAPGRRPWPRPGASARREHQREPACRRGHILLGHPQAQANELGLDVGLERRQRLDQALGRQVAAFRDLHHHAQDPPRPERNHQHRPHAHALVGGAQQVVERATQAARGGERLDLRDHPVKLGR